MLEDFGVVQTKPVTMYIDNQSAIKLVKNGESRNRAKHIDVKYHFVTNLVKKRIVEIQYYPTDEMMTKPMEAVKLKKHREGCQLVEIKRSIN